MTTPRKKVSYAGLTPKVARAVKAAYRIGLSNGKALQKAATNSRLMELQSERNNAVDKIALYLDELGKLRSRIAELEMASNPDPLRYLPLGRIENDTGAIVEIDTGRPMEVGVPVCIVCDNNPSPANSPCVECGLSHESTFDDNGAPRVD